MCQEKEEEEHSPKLKMARMYQYKDYNNVLKKGGKQD